MEIDLVADRACDECAACCTHLKIDVPELRKPAGLPCSNCAAGVGCAIHDARPPVCRGWYCGWRRLGWVDARPRPDRSDGSIRVAGQDLPATYDPSIGLDISILNEAGIGAPGLAETICHAIRSNIATSLCVPDEPACEAGECR